MANKIFVLDTNVLLYDPESIIKFPNSQVVIPLTVIEELDAMKRLSNELGKNSRAVVRFLDGLKKTGKGNLNKGVKIDNNSLIRVLLEVKNEHRQVLSPSIADNRIIMTALSLKEEGGRVVFVSKDLAARIKAEALGLEVEDYENLKYSYDNIYHGLRSLTLPKHEIDLLLKDGKIKVPNLEYYQNEYISITSPEGSTAIGKYNKTNSEIEAMLKLPPVWGIKPRNAEQRCAFDLLLRNEIKLVTLMGQAGTGKTLMALACGLRKVFDEGEYSRILISRPIVPLGRDIGYLPGTKEEKLSHWMQPIYDNLEFLCASTTTSRDTKDTLSWVMESRKIEMEAVTYIRGRSLPKMFIIIDEAQNLTPHEIKTIISRAGEGTKVILAGDPTQIDNPYLDKDSNGLTYAVGRFRDQNLYGHIFLDKTERSDLAELATKLL
jgi:PhoH-like ATPase